uniref:Sperm antigen with calponin homology and coiled-coil domains 1 n=1 Tax=Poecilia reticulata TaxID=8081 RepID=A0A3P9NHM2_POERE
MLKTAHSERDKLEVELTELRQELLKAQAETEHVRATVSKVGRETFTHRLREQELSDRVTSLEEAGVQAENQVKEMKETIFELEDQVEQQRAVNCHTNQAVLDMENLVKKIEEQKGEAERQLKVLNRQMKEEREEWRRFQADLQTAVVVANDIKVEAQQELRTLRRQLQEEQDRNAKLSADLQAMQGVRYYPPFPSPLPPPSHLLPNPLRHQAAAPFSLNVPGCDIPTRVLPDLRAATIFRQVAQMIPTRNKLLLKRFPNFLFDPQRGYVFIGGIIKSFGVRVPGIWQTL